MATEQKSGNPARLPLVVSPDNRDQTTSRDARLVNAYAEKSLSGMLMVYKRPGLVAYSQVTAGVGLGCYNWLGDVYSIVGSTVYKNGVALSGTVNSTSPYTFSSILGANPTLFFHNLTSAYSYNSGSGILVVNPSQLSSMVPGQAYLDGTTYVMIPNATIYGSGINDVSTASWNALTDLIAQIEPDQAVATAKQLVYVIALKQWSTEVFYDAGNPSGSPLAPVQGAKVNYGCRAAGSVCDIEGQLFWVSTARGGNVGVLMMDNLKVQPIETAPIAKLLQQDDFTITWSFALRINGHKFYVLTLKNSNLTLAYDASTGLWAQWTDANGNYFPFVSATFAANQQVILQHETNGAIYQMTDTAFTDYGNNIVVDIYTPNFDADTRRSKTLWRLDVISDQTDGSTLTAYSSDDDYQTWSNPRVVDLSRKRPNLTDCGSFYRRAYHFNHVGNVPFRIQAIEMALEVGSI